MILSEFITHLRNSPDLQLCFALPDGGLIEAHAHITEVGRVEKTFIDCGGTIRKTAHCLLQAWVADDVEHRLTPQQLSSIIAKAAAILGNDDLDVEIEYEDCQISQFPVGTATTSNGTLLFQLGSKHTDCLAKELCLPKTSSECSAGSGCC